MPPKRKVTEAAAAGSTTTEPAAHGGRSVVSRPKSGPAAALDAVELRRRLLESRAKNAALRGLVNDQILRLEQRLRGISLAITLIRSHGAGADSGVDNRQDDDDDDMFAALDEGATLSASPASATAGTAPRTRQLPPSSMALHGTPYGSCGDAPSHLQDPFTPAYLVPSPSPSTRNGDEENADGVNPDAHADVGTKRKRNSQSLTAAKAARQTTADTLSRRSVTDFEIRGPPQQRQQPSAHGFPNPADRWQQAWTPSTDVQLGNEVHAAAKKLTADNRVSNLRELHEAMKRIDDKHWKLIAQRINKANEQAPVSGCAPTVTGMCCRLRWWNILWKRLCRSAQRAAQHGNAHWILERKTDQLWTQEETSAILDCLRDANFRLCRRFFVTAVSKSRLLWRSPFEVAVHVMRDLHPFVARDVPQQHVSHTILKGILTQHYLRTHEGATLASANDHAPRIAAAFVKTAPRRIVDDAALLRALGLVHCEGCAYTTIYNAFVTESDAQDGEEEGGAAHPPLFPSVKDVVDAAIAANFCAPGARSVFVTPKVICERARLLRHHQAPAEEDGAANATKKPRNKLPRLPVADSIAVHLARHSSVLGSERYTEWMSAYFFRSTNAAIGDAAIVKQLAADLVRRRERVRDAFGSREPPPQDPNDDDAHIAADVDQQDDAQPQAQPPPLPQWTDADASRLIEYVADLNSNFRAVQGAFPGRSIADLKRLHTEAVVARFQQRRN